MAHFTVKEIRLHRLQVPLKKPFTTHLQSVKERESIVVEIIDETGEVGLGECVAFSSPWYTEETIQTCWDALTNWLIPSILHKQITHPKELMEHLKHVKGNRMAKAALDLAGWDLFAKRKKVPLAQLIGGVRQRIDAGIVLTGALDEEMDEKLKGKIEEGYKRVKIKIDETTNMSALKEFVNRYPALQYFADANGIFSRLGMERLKAFDDVGLTLIEQPFLEDEWLLHREASRTMKTPIALDESIRSFEDVKQMIRMKAGKVIVLKPGRVGGISESIRIHQVAQQSGIPIWIGGMIELGLSKAHNLALASLSQMIYPGDFSASNHYWEADIVSPAIEVKNGQIDLNEKSGIGYELDREVLAGYRVGYTIFRE